MFLEQLNLNPGILCLTGGGGKTTLAHALADALSGTVIFCTTTKILPSAELPVFCEQDAAALQAALARHRAICIGTPTESGKLTLPLLPFSQLRALADYIIVEADGSKQLPMKAHLPHEPVLPAGYDRWLHIVGASGFARPIKEAAHRAERFAALAGTSIQETVTPTHLANVLRAESGFDTLLINQVTNAHDLAYARELSQLVDVPVFAGEFQKRTLAAL